MRNLKGRPVLVTMLLLCLSFPAAVQAEKNERNSNVLSVIE